MMIYIRIMTRFFKKYVETCDPYMYIKVPEKKQNDTQKINAGGSPMKTLQLISIKT